MVPPYKCTRILCKYECSLLSHTGPLNLYLQPAIDHLQQQEVSASRRQEQQPGLSGRSKTHMEQHLNRRLRRPQVDVAVPEERRCSSETGETSINAFGLK